MSKSAFVGAALMASLASEVFSSPTLKFAPRDPWYAAQHAEDHSYHNNPVHVPYPSYLLETHEVRQGVGEYIASVFNPPTDHNYGLRDSESFYWGMGMMLPTFVSREVTDYLRRSTTHKLYNICA